MNDKIVREDKESKCTISRTREIAPVLLCGARHMTPMHNPANIPHTKLQKIMHLETDNV